MKSAKVTTQPVIATFPGDPPPRQAMMIMDMTPTMAEAPTIA